MQCGVCLEEEEGLRALGRDVGQLSGSKCSHSFCFPCIKRWSETSNTCPTCRERFSAIHRKRWLPSAEAESPRAKRQRLQLVEVVEVSEKVQVSGGGDATWRIAMQ